MKLASARYGVMFLLLVAVGLVGVSSPSPATTGGGGSFVPVTPVRIADTANGTGFGSTGSFTEGQMKSLSIVGVGGIPTSNVGAVVFDIAGTSNVDTRLYAWPSDEDRGLAALSLVGEAPDSTTMIVRPGPDGKIKLHNEHGSTRVNLDVQGYFTKTSTDTSTGGFVPITTKRVVNTSSGTGISSKVVGGTTYTVSVGGVGGIPADAVGIYANIRVQNASADGGLRITPSNLTPSSAPILLSYDTTGAYDSGAAIALGPDGKVKLWTTSGSNIDVTVDVQGYFTAGTGGGGFQPISNRRIFDSRTSAAGSLKAGETRTIKLTGQGGLPDDGTVGSVAMTITVRDWSASGGVGVANADTGIIGIGNIAFRGSYDGVAPQTTSFVEVSGSGQVVVQNSSNAPVNVLLNAQGWFTRTKLPPSQPEPEPTSTQDALTPAPRVIRSLSENASTTFEIPFPAGYSLVASGLNKLNLKDASGTIVGSYEGAAFDASDSSESSEPTSKLVTSLSVNGKKIVQNVTLPSNAVFPIIAAPVYMSLQDEQEDLS